jgi:phosphoserine phosphatase RsbU/P
MNRRFVLLVDDDGEILRSLQRELDELFQELHLTPELFDDPLKALEFIKSENRDIGIIIADQKMPGLSGSDLIRKTAEINESIVSVLLTAYSDIDTVVSSVRSGISGFMLKPWNERELAGEVRKAYEKHLSLCERSRQEANLNSDMYRSGQFQQKYLSAPLPNNERIKVTVSYHPVMACGGDYYDIIPIDEDNYLILIADVAGHGVNAAFITFIIKTLVGDSAFRALLHRNLSVQSLISWLNIRLNRELANVQPLIISLCIGLFDLKNMAMKICNGGHMPPFVIRDDRAEILNIKGTALGFSEEIPYFEKTFPLKRKDRVVFYTDGISRIEDRGAPLKKMMEFHRSNRYFTTALMNDIKAELSSEPFADDMTIISVEVH